MAVASFSVTAPVSADVPIIPPVVPIPVIPNIPSTPADTAPPAFKGAETGDNGNEVTLNFDEPISINSGDEKTAEFLKSNISVAVDGVNFAPIQEQSYIDWGSNYIYIEYEYDMQVILGSNTRIKIAANTIKDAVNNGNAEMILDVTPPAIQSVTLSSDNREVTVAYSVYAYDNTDGTLKSKIRLSRGGVSEPTYLAENDTVSVEGGVLTIHLAQALSGPVNIITIDGNAIRDAIGNTDNDERTGIIAANGGAIDPIDTVKPYFIYAYHNFNAVTFIFSENITVPDADAAVLLQGIEIYDYNYGYRTLPSDAVLTFSGNRMTLELGTFTGTAHQIRFNPANLIVDASGNSYGSTTMYAYPDSYEPTFGADADDSYLSYNGRKLTIDFDPEISDLLDLTLVNGTSRLNEHIKISLDQGVTYSALAQNDRVVVQNDRVIIYFHTGKPQGSIHVKFDANILGDLYDLQRNIAETIVVAYNTPDMTGYLFSNAPTELAFADNAEWRSKVKAVYLNGLQVPASDYSLTEGKLTLKQGLFQKGYYYEIEIQAEGYSSKVYWSRAYRSSEIFYMTTPDVVRGQGITATISLFNNVFGEESFKSGTQTVIFQLMDEDIPVSIISADFKVSTGTYTGHFNVADGMNPKYTVKAFVVSKNINDPNNLGLNLATVKTQEEIDQLIMEQDYEEH